MQRIFTWNGNDNLENVGTGLMLRPLLPSDSSLWVEPEEAVQEAIDANWSLTDGNCIIIAIGSFADWQLSNVMKEPYSGDNSFPVGGGGLSYEIIADCITGGMTGFGRASGWYDQILTELQNSGYDVTYVILDAESKWTAGTINVESSLGVFNPDNTGTEVGVDIFPMKDISGITGVIHWMYNQPKYSGVLPAVELEELTGSTFGFGDRRKEQAAYIWNYYAEQQRAKGLQIFADVTHKYYPDALVANYQMKKNQFGTTIGYWNGLPKLGDKATLDNNTNLVLYLAGGTSFNMTGTIDLYNMADGAIGTQLPTDNHRITAWFLDNLHTDNIWDPIEQTGLYITGEIDKTLDELTGTLLNTYGMPFIIAF